MARNTNEKERTYSMTEKMFVFLQTLYREVQSKQGEFKSFDEAMGALLREVENMKKTSLPKYENNLTMMKSAYNVAVTAFRFAEYALAVMDDKMKYLMICDAIEEAIRMGKATEITEFIRKKINAVQKEPTSIDDIDKIRDRWNADCSRR